MSFLSALPTILSVVGSISGAQSGRNQARKGERAINDAIGRSTNAYTNALRSFQNRQTAGYYDATKANELAQTEAAKALAIGQGNNAARLANMGYRRGDSVLTQQPRLYSDQAQLQLANQLEQNKLRYGQIEQNDALTVQDYLNRLNALTVDQGRQDVANGNAQAANAWGGLSSAIGGGLSSGADWSWLKRGTSAVPQYQGPFDLNGFMKGLSNIRVR